MAEILAVRAPELGRAEQLSLARLAGGRFDRLARLLDPKAAKRRSVLPHVRLSRLPRRGFRPGRGGRCAAGKRPGMRCRGEGAGGGQGAGTRLPHARCRAAGTSRAARGRTGGAPRPARGASDLVSRSRRRSPSARRAPSSTSTASRSCGSTLPANASPARSRRSRRCSRHGGGWRSSTSPPNSLSRRSSSSSLRTQ